MALFVGRMCGSLESWCGLRWVVFRRVIEKVLELYLGGVDV